MRQRRADGWMGMTLRTFEPMLCYMYMDNISCVCNLLVLTEAITDFFFLLEFYSRLSFASMYRLKAFQIRFQVRGTCSIASARHQRRRHCLSSASDQRMILICSDSPAK